jgi:hypothetical protein
VIREWLATWRRRARAGVGPALDPTLFLGAQFDFAAAQMEGLRDALAEARKELAEERAAHALEVARLRVSLATALSMQYLQAAAHRAPRPGDEPTVVVSAEQYRRPR